MSNIGVCVCRGLKPPATATGGKVTCNKCKKKRGIKWGYSYE